LRELLCPAAIDATSPAFARVGDSLEQGLYLATIPDQTWLGWLLHLMQAPRPFSLSVHVRATDRYRERAAQRRRYRRLWGVNRGLEMRARPVDPAKLQQEQEAADLNHELATSAGAGIYDLSVYLSVREPGPNPDPALLRETTQALEREAVASSDARLRLARGAQRAVWQSTLPLGVDAAARRRKYVSRNVGDTFPLVGTSCGSPGGIPLGYAQPGRTLERLDPFDPAHDNHLLVVNGKSGTGKTMTTILILLRILARGGRGFIVDRAGHFDFLCSLVPGAQAVPVGARDSGHAINPWDVPDVERPGNEKVDYLLALHALLIGGRGAEDDQALGIVEQNQLGLAIRAVYDRCALTGELARETLLQEELYRRAADEQDAGALELASRLRMLAESLHNYVGDGPYAYLTDRPTTVPAGAPLVAFDTRRVPDDLAGAVLFMIAEHVTSRIESERERFLGAERWGGEWEGRTFLVIDEAWKLIERRATGRWVNELARRSRHLALFLVAISQQLSDFRSEYGKALLANASMLLLLRQLPEELTYVRDALRLSDEEIHAVASLQTAKRQFSSAFFMNGSRGRGVVQIRVGALEYWIATNDPNQDEPLRRRALREARGDPWRAVVALAGE
jgi:DNA helicase HerA-like ATPase